MGLLDDAIREHLEFKRLRGADPSEVNREEREALAPVLRGEEAPSAVHMTDSEAPAANGESHAFFDGASAPLDLDHGYASQETMELDMRAILEAEPTEHDGSPQPDASPPALSAGLSRTSAEHPASGGHSTGGFLEWELPEERSPDFSEQLWGEEPPRRRRIVDVREGAS